MTNAFRVVRFQGSGFNERLELAFCMAAIPEQTRVIYKDREITCNVLELQKAHTLNMNVLLEKQKVLATVRRDYSALKKGCERSITM